MCNREDKDHNVSHRVGLSYQSRYQPGKDTGLLMLSQLGSSDQQHKCIPNSSSFLHWDSNT
jgi:hypothetical protein